MVKKLLHTRYRVTDLEKTCAFYRDVLGLAEVSRHSSPRGSELVFFKAPGSEETIEICKYDASGPVNVGHDITHLAFEVDDIEVFAKHSASKGEQPLNCCLKLQLIKKSYLITRLKYSSIDFN